jgi:hypothetical protein
VLVKSKRPGNTGLISQRKNYSKNLIPPSRTLQTVEEILPGHGKIFTMAAQSSDARIPRRPPRSRGRIYQDVHNFVLALSASLL